MKASEETTYPDVESPCENPTLPRMVKTESKGTGKGKKYSTKNQPRLRPRRANPQANRSRYRDAKPRFPQLKKAIPSKGKGTTKRHSEVTLQYGTRPNAEERDNSRHSRKWQGL